MTELSRCSPRSMEANMRGRPSPSTSTPIICTMVTMPEHPVVGVVGRREPGEVDPGPADRESSQSQSRPAPGDEMTGRQHMGELGCGKAEAGRERQVEQQLQTARDAVRPRADRARPFCAGSGAVTGRRARQSSTFLVPVSAQRSFACSRPRSPSPPVTLRSSPPRRGPEARQPAAGPARPRRRAVLRATPDRYRKARSRRPHPARRAP